MAIKPSLHSARSQSARLRIRVYLLHSSQQELILSQLSNYEIGVNTIGATRLARARQRKLDLELTGAIAQIQSGLTYLESLNLKLEGKPNPDGDSWYY